MLQLRWKGLFLAKKFFLYILTPKHFTTESIIVDLRMMSFRTTFDPFLHHIDKVPSLRKRPTGAHSCQTRSSRNYFVGVCFVCMFYCVIRLLLVNIIYFIVSSFEEISCKLKFNGAQTVITIGIGIHRWLLASCGIVSNIAQFIVYFERICMVVFEASDFWGGCKYYIGPIGDLSLLTATAAG